MTPEAFKRATAAPSERFEDNETRRFDEFMAALDRLEAQLDRAVAAAAASGKASKDR